LLRQKHPEAATLANAPYESLSTTTFFAAGITRFEYVGNVPRAAQLDLLRARCFRRNRRRLSTRLLALQSPIGSLNSLSDLPEIAAANEELRRISNVLSGPEINTGDDQ
jgi:hypothetical protein